MPYLRISFQCSGTSFSSSSSAGAFWANPHNYKGFVRKFWGLEDWGASVHTPHWVHCHALFWGGLQQRLGLPGVCVPFCLSIFLIQASWGIISWLRISKHPETDPERTYFWILSSRGSSHGSLTVLSVIFCLSRLKPPHPGQNCFFRIFQWFCDPLNPDIESLLS